MTRIAFLGLGAMGSRMVLRLADAGYELVVWNRHIERVQPLVREGVTVASTPREAAEGADMVFSMLRDDDASSTVWLDQQDGALFGMAPGALAVECSTLSPAHVQSLSEQARVQGVRFLTAPVAGSRPQAEAGELIFLAGGEPEIVDYARETLLTMGGAVHHTGDAASAALIKLMVNAMLGVQLSAVAELIGLADRCGLDAKQAWEIIRSTPVCSPAVGGASAAMLAGAFSPAFPIELVAKDFGLLKGERQRTGAQLPMCDAAGLIYEQAAMNGLGCDNITGVVQRYRS